MFIGRPAFREPRSTRASYASPAPAHAPRPAGRRRRPRRSDGRNTLRQKIDRSRTVFQKRGRGLPHHIDETRGDRQARDVDYARGLGAGETADRGDAAAADRQVGAIPGRTAPVHNPAVAKNQVVRLARLLGCCT